jgi:sterol desaturase/sphingolipid hydroxylase (fatty acid hydroxylase superfamily)
MVTLIVLASLMAAVFALERIVPLGMKRMPSPRRFLATDIAWFFVAGTAGVIVTLLLAPLLERTSLGPVASLLENAPKGVQLAIGVVVYDLVSTAIHRGMHASDVLWAVHKVHHSSRELDALATTRAHMLENLVRQVPAQTVLFVLGFSGATVAVVAVIFAAWAVVGHSNLRIGARWIEMLFVTPRVHHLHHVPATSQRNFATVFTAWDRVTNRFVSMPSAPWDEFGVPGEVESYPQRFVDAVREPLKEIHGRRHAHLTS